MMALMAVYRIELRRSLFGLATEQAGHFSAAQAKGLGYSYQAQAHHVEVGNWVRVERGVFRLADWVAGVHDEFSMWTLWARGKAVVSHGSALAVLGIGEFESGRVHLTVPRNFRMTDSALVLHRGELPERDTEQHVGFRVTTPMRTIIDVASQSPDEEQLARAIEQAVREGLLSVRSLRSRAEMVDVGAALRIERALNVGVKR
jgi:predicted transcriptional regulator of viral defense system